MGPVEGGRSSDAPHVSRRWDWPPVRGLGQNRAFSEGIRGSVVSKPHSWASTLLCVALLAALPLAHASGEDAAPAGKPRSMQEILDASKPADWRTPEAKNTLYLDL